ncbi:hypothetical protein GW17_00029812 [Ensete ventricosum]|nr:hypothetical protein GW17_00029812 [Ensete ventricosum]RZR79955.1 hypothetical protein BHM03_00005833 [Ensete ventricosum]
MQIHVLQSFLELGMPSNPEMAEGLKNKVRIYTADGVIGELERSKMDYLQASVVVTTTKRILIPHLLHSNMHDFARDLDSLVDWVVNQLPTSWPLRKSMLECLKGRTAAKISHTVDVIPNNSEFQYLLPM